ncbi:MAG: ferritin family protein [Phycisphaerae bacterium]|nr:ferritin family protein [Phycisphaerae bacterium]
MAKLNPDKELLTQAIQREIDARNLFLALSRHVINPGIIKTLEELAKEETEHKQVLELELMKIGVTVDTEIDKKPFKITDYVTSNTATFNMDYKDVLELCIQKEDASFNFYADILARTKNENLKKVLRNLMEQELRHKIRFENQLKNSLIQPD